MERGCASYAKEKMTPGDAFKVFILRVLYVAHSVPENKRIINLFLYRQASLVISTMRPLNPANLILGV